MSDNLHLTFAAHVTAADTETRTISGVVVPFGKVGNTSAGKVVFELGSIHNPDPSNVKFLLQHDPTKPLGKAASFEVTPGGINGSFKVSATTAGNDALVEAQDGLRDGLSVGASIHSFEVKEGVMHVTSATIEEVSLVHAPAFSDAVVTQVAASETDDDETETAENLADVQEEDTMESENIAEVEAAATVTAAAPVYATTAPRSPIVNAATYLEHSILAAQGSDESRQYVRAADDSSSTNTGLTLAPHLQEFISSTYGGRPALEACSRGTLPASGLSFTIPRMGTAPTVADADEAAAFSETGMTSDYITVNVNKFAGMNTVSLELIDRSSPAFYDELLRQMNKAYAKATDNAVIAAFTASGTAATGVAATAAGLQSFIATESAAAFKATSDYASNLVVSTDQWAAIMGYADSTGRPLYTAANPANNPGAVGGQSIRGQILGTDLYVDPNIATTGVVDESAFLVAPDAVTVYESPTTRLQVNVIGSGQVEVGVYGYLAIAVKKAGGVRRFNLT